MTRRFPALVRPRQALEGRGAPSVLLHFSHPVDRSAGHRMSEAPARSRSFCRRSGDRATHGAACHGYLLIAETSCEMRNLFLDRNLVVPTIAMDGTSFFEIARR
jgi:hypothetical protein